MKLSLSLLLCFFVPFIMIGQAPVAAFTVNVTSGCAPLQVNFTDQSTGSPKFWNWDFGNGSLSSIQNPSISFGNGTYTVTLVVRNNDGISSITKTNLIVSDPSPSVAFSADKTIACLPADIQFTDASVANAGTINEWHWDFGDGKTDNTKNPKHTYTAPGYYDIYLSVKSTSGCGDANSKGRYIRIVNGVKADFSYSGPSTCSPPYNVAYKNLTSGPGVLTYAWDLGNATTSTALSPSTTYSTGGNYTVKLKAQSDFGCADSVQKVIPINGITTSIKSADSVCLGAPVVFQNNSSTTPVKVLWNFGDGTTSTLLNPPAKTYTSPGTYTVTLNATFANCSDIATKTVKVYGKPTVDFYSGNSNNCKPPHSVIFQNLSPDVVSANWTFSDGGTSTALNPTHTFNSIGNFDVSLTIIDSKGCTNTISRPQYVHILSPGVSISGSPPGVCVNKPYKPLASIGTVDGIASYAWDFGDASPVDNSANPSHTYTATGNYTVKLTITTNGGCTASANTGVTVGNPPVIDFTKDKSAVCRSGVVSFTNLSVPPGSAVLWNFGDGTTSTLQNPLPHKFPDTGFYTIQLKVTSNGCTDSLLKTNFVYVQPPVSNFGYKTNCANKTAVTFSDSSVINPALPPVSYLWNFGDPGNNTNTTASPSFTYPAIGNYNVQLIVTNGACFDTLKKTIELIDEKATFKFNKTPATYCRNEPITLSSTSNRQITREHRWVIDGAAPLNAHGDYTISFNSTGNHTAQFILVDINGCTDTSAVQTFIVTGPTALFGIIKKGGCKNSAVVFSDSSISAPGRTITKWTFDFGDGTPAKSFTSPPFTHAYADTGVYKVKLTISDNLGCSDTYTDTMGAVITKPYTYFTADKTTFCPGTPLQFTDSSIGKGLSYAWNFGDGGTANIQNPLHSYNDKDSVYTVKLIITDSVGCIDSLTRTNYINIRTPKALYDVKDTATLCPPLETKFSFKGKDYDSYLWDFGDGGSSSLANTSHFYNTYGKYTAKLYVTGYGGCVDSASININVTNPYLATSISFDPKTACNELTVNFSVVPPYSTRFKMFFGDGSIDSSQQNSFQHFYNLPNLYSPYILLSDSVGCIIVIGGLGNVDIKGAVPLFGMDRKKFCDSGTVYFTDYSQDGNDKIVTRTWDFGDGTGTVLTKDAIHNYTKPGLYIPALTVTSQTGCTKSFTDTIRVLATPDPIITSADGVCKNLFLSFAGSLLVPPDTAITWKWDFGNGQTSDKQNVLITYPDTGIHRITLQATNSLGCKGDTSKNITLYSLPVITLSGDTTLVSGGPGITIPLTYSSNTVSYNWTPPTDLSCADCPNPFASPKFTTTYNVKVTDVNGCVSSRNVKLVAICTNNNFFLPNTFSPNNDGTNDRFYPRGTGLDRIQALRIFNRWGEMVFEKRNFPPNDALSGWDGTYKGKPAATDTYIYMIDIICANANVITTKGNVTLIR